MALSEWDRQNLTKPQQDAILHYTAQWERAHANGDQTGMALAHAGAEKVRGMAGYSGGSEGTAYHTPSSRGQNATGGTLSCGSSQSSTGQQILHGGMC